MCNCRNLNLVQNPKSDLAKITGDNKRRRSKMQRTRNGAKENLTDKNMLNALSSIATWTN